MDQNFLLMIKDIKRFYPIIDNGMGLSVTAWAVAMLGAVRGRNVFCHISTPYCGQAMDLATHYFLQSSCEEMILIDTDLVFTPEQLACLLSHDEPLVFGLYPKRKVAFELPLMALPEKPEPFAGNEVLCEVAATARGFMRVHRFVFEQMKPTTREVEYPGFGPVYQFWPLAPDGTSEDFAFCAKWRALGGRILVDRRALVQHVGQVRFPIEA